MVRNAGKVFEECFKKSVPEQCWMYRLRDSSGAWGQGENTRFTPSNICDFMVMSGFNLYLFELKSHKGASIPFNIIRANQLSKLSSIKHENIKAYFIFNFRELEKTYAIKAQDLAEYVDKSNRKSIPVKWCEEVGILIPQQKKKVNWRYELGELLEYERIRS